MNIKEKRNKKKLAKRENESFPNRFIFILLFVLPDRTIRLLQIERASLFQYVLMIISGCCVFAGIKKSLQKDGCDTVNSNNPMLVITDRLSKGFSGLYVGLTVPSISCQQSTINYYTCQIQNTIKSNAQKKDTHKQ